MVTQTNGVVYNIATDIRTSRIIVESEIKCAGLPLAKEQDQIFAEEIDG